MDELQERFIPMQTYLLRELNEISRRVEETVFRLQQLMEQIKLGGYHESLSMRIKKFIETWPEETISAKSIFDGMAILTQKNRGNTFRVIHILIKQGKLWKTEYQGIYSKVPTSYDPTKDTLIRPGRKKAKAKPTIKIIKK